MSERLKPVVFKLGGGNIVTCGGAATLNTVAIAGFDQQMALILHSEIQSKLLAAGVDEFMMFINEKGTNLLPPPPIGIQVFMF